MQPPFALANPIANGDCTGETISSSLRQRVTSWGGLIYTCQNPWHMVPILEIVKIKVYQIEVNLIWVSPQPIATHDGDTKTAKLQTCRCARSEKGATDKAKKV
ncbi:hypothetical protein ABW19_dt0206691 [Dactylella cylindrospora]|nr:hypothetical protein ABW19_dt0206691 [Dactylella cylindrospora]